MTLGQSPGHALGHDQVRGPELPHGEQPTHQRVDPGVRRVGHDPEGMAGPAERCEVELEDGDRAAMDLGAEGCHPARMELHGEDAAARPRERDGQRTLARTEVDDDVARANR
jgi:hypothetical protein